MAFLWEFQLQKQFEQQMRREYLRLKIEVLSRSQNYTEGSVLELMVKTNGLKEKKRRTLLLESVRATKE